VQTEAGPRFLLKNGQRQELDVAAGSVNWLSFTDYTLDIGFYADAVERKKKPDERMFAQLFDYSDVPEAERPAMRAEAHQRVTWPIYTLALPLYVLAVLLSNEYNRRGQWKRIVFAGVSALMLVLVNFALRSLAVKHPAAIMLMYLFAFGVLGSALAVLMSGRFIRSPNWKQWLGMEPARQVPA